MHAVCSVEKKKKKKKMLLQRCSFPLPTVYCMYMWNSFALHGTIQLPEHSHTFHLQSVLHGFQTAT